MFCRSLFVLLYFLFWPLCYLFFFDLRILITTLASSDSPDVGYYNRTWWMLCQKLTVHIKLDIYVYMIQKQILLKRKKIFNLIFRIMDDVLSINNRNFVHWIPLTYMYQQRIRDKTNNRNILICLFSNSQHSHQS